MANKYGYQIHKQSESVGSGTRHVEIDIVKLDTNDGGRGSRVLSLSWQSGISPDPDGQARYWYGMRYEPSDVDSFDKLNEVVRLTRRIIPRDTGWFYITPVDVVQVCESKHIKRVWYDSRLSGYVTRDKMPDPALDRWLALDSRGHCTVDCLAFDNEDAERKLIAAFGEEMAKNHRSTYGKKLVDWYAAGRPMKNASQQSWGQAAPVIIETAELLRLDEPAELQRVIVDELVAA